MHHYLSIGLVSGCTDTIESNTELDAHIEGNLLNVQQNTRRTTNDVARRQPTEIICKTNIDTLQQTTGILDNQDPLIPSLPTLPNIKSFR